MDVRRDRVFQTGEGFRTDSSGRDQTVSKHHLLGGEGGESGGKWKEAFFPLLVSPLYSSFSVPSVPRKTLCYLFVVHCQKT